MYPTERDPRFSALFSHSGVYFGSGQQTLLGIEEPHGPGRQEAWESHGVSDEIVQNKLTKVLSAGWVGHGDFRAISGPPRAVCGAKHTQVPSSWQTSVS